MRDRRDFMRAYETYFHALSAFDTGFRRPFIMPRLYRGKDVQDDLSVRVPENPNDVSESEWIAYFLQARQSRVDDYTTVDAAIKYLKMRTTFPDAASRMDQLRADMHHILDEHTVEQRAEKVVKYFIAVLEPADFREAIQKRLQYTQYNALMSDIVKCFTWISSKLKAYLVWQPPIARVKSQARPSNKAGNPRRRQQNDSGNVPGNASGSATGGLRRAQTRFPQGERRRQSLEMEPFHGVPVLTQQCPGIASDEVERLLAARKTTVVSESNTGVKRVQVVPEGDADTVPVRVTPARGAVGPKSSMTDDGNAQATIDGYTLQTTLLDNGMDDSVVSGGIIRALESAGVTIREYSVSRNLDPFGEHIIPVKRKVRPLLLRKLKFLVYEEDRTFSLTIGRPAINCLGYSTDGLLAAARTRQSEYELLNTNEVTSADHSHLARQQAMRTRTLETLDEDGDELDELVTSPSLANEATSTVQGALELKIKEAIETVYQMKRLRDLLIRYIDVFRLSFGNDPPVRVPPLRVDLKNPVKAKARRYLPGHKRYLIEHTQELFDHGLVVENHRSRWASVPCIVAKRQAGQYRVAVDTRAANALAEPIPWPMPDIEGYWQLPLDEDSQERYTIMARRGVVEMIYGPLLSGQIRAWLDDMLGFASYPVNLRDILRKVLKPCETSGLKLHPLKCCFFTREATWCGRMTSADGVRHCPSRVEGLVNLPAPRTAGELQKFLCAVNRMRGNIPGYDALASSLYKVLESAATVAQSRKKTHLNHVLLNTIGWTSDHDTALVQVKGTLLKMVTLIHPKQEWEVCLFADASQAHFGTVVTQIPPEDVCIHKQCHQPLAFLGGSFVGMSRWSNIDKEAYAIVVSSKRLMYLLLLPLDFDFLRITATYNTFWIR
ncbi:LOW QUALITY PROTEIN: Hypothetical protein PHPALM_19572 [Phytophthora palmivora]|uniref:Reverse transcriptase/retrotransposon-derived protein RNase H-like domain-containing protein n=1 Tax=Phytophthora palmivora TaxID=4796 RepID=A0A2P4XH21_9STRA|nr:LOW QUALITY PROTEIN: Hypothetical protein PHPALM_19572 [Phytophthora palmivora]